MPKSFFGGNFAALWSDLLKVQTTMLRDRVCFLVVPRTADFLVLCLLCNSGAAVDFVDNY